MPLKYNEGIGQKKSETAFLLRTNPKAKYRDMFETIHKAILKQVEHERILILNIGD